MKKFIKRLSTFKLSQKVSLLHLAWVIHTFDENDSRVTKVESVTFELLSKI